MKGLAKFLLKLGGWKYVGNTPSHNKGIIVAAPHTSAWDWYWGMLALKSVDIPTYILIKKEFFVFPFGPILKALGAIPVDRGNSKNNMVGSLKAEFDKHERAFICITPEGSRKLRKKWKKGFLVLAQETGLPVYLGGLNYEKKEIWTGVTFELTGDIDADLKAVQAQYKEAKAKYPKMFSAGV